LVIEDKKFLIGTDEYELNDKNLKNIDRILLKNKIKRVTIKDTAN